MNGALRPSTWPTAAISRRTAGASPLEGDISKKASRHKPGSPEGPNFSDRSMSWGIFGEAFAVASALAALGLQTPPPPRPRLRAAVGGELSLASRRRTPAPSPPPPPPSFRREAAACPVRRGRVPAEGTRSAAAPPAGGARPVPASSRWALPSPLLLASNGDPANTRGLQSPRPVPPPGQSVCASPPPPANPRAQARARRGSQSVGGTAADSPPPGWPRGSAAPLPLGAAARAGGRAAAVLGDPLRSGQEQAAAAAS